ncbi:MAG: hypothetical protein ACK4XK_05430 [Casimicrobiaceae bacterium]
MTITEAEWLRSLPVAVAGHTLRIEGRVARITIQEAGLAASPRTLAITWSPASDLVLASIRLSRLRVNFDLTGVPPAMRADFMRRFDMHMQRGGG